MSAGPTVSERAAPAGDLAPARARSAARGRKWPLFWLVLLVALLLTAEGLLQVLARSSRHVGAILAPSPPAFTVADRELVWRGNPNYPEHDQLGFRNPQVPPDAGVVTLGDSQTYGSNVARERAWPRQLERLGQGSIYNMAFPGWGPLQSYLLLDEALALKPEVILAALYTGNDLVDAYTFVYHRKRLTRQFRSEDPSVRAALEAAEDAAPWDGTPLADQAPEDERRREPEPAPSSLGEAVELHSKLFGLGRAVWRAYDYHRRHPTRPEEDSETDPLKDDDYLRFRTAEFRTVLTPSYRLPAVTIADPRLAEGGRITHEALTAMQAQAAAAGVQFAVVLIPTKELVLAEVVGEQYGDVPAVYSRLVENETQLHRLLAERLQAERIALVDPLPQLRQLVRRGVLPYSATKDGHLSPDGHQAVAEAVRAAVGP